MAKIEKIEKGGSVIYPVTVTQAVLDIDSGKTMKQVLGNVAMQDGSYSNMSVGSASNATNLGGKNLNNIPYGYKSQGISADNASKIIKITFAGSVISSFLHLRRLSTNGEGLLYINAYGVGTLRGNAMWVLNLSSYVAYIGGNSESRGCIYISGIQSSDRYSIIDNMDRTDISFVDSLPSDAVQVTRILAATNSVVNKAKQLETPRTINIKGGATGSADFDGSKNIDIETEVNWKNIKDKPDVITQGENELDDIFSLRFLRSLFEFTPNGFKFLTGDGAGIDIDKEVSVTNGDNRIYFPDKPGTVALTSDIREPKTWALESMGFDNELASVNINGKPATAEVYSQIKVGDTFSYINQESSALPNVIVSEVGDSNIYAFAVDFYTGTTFRIRLVNNSGVIKVEDRRS